MSKTAEDIYSSFIKNSDSLESDSSCFKKIKTIIDDLRYTTNSIYLFEDFIAKIILSCFEQNYSNILTSIIRISQKHNTPSKDALEDMIQTGISRAILLENLDILRTLNKELPLSLKANDEYNFLKSINRSKNEIAIFFIEECKSNIHINDDYPIRICANKGNFDLFIFLAERGSNIFINDNACLHSSVSNGHLNIVEYILNKDIHLVNEIKAAEIKNENISAFINKLVLEKILIHQPENKKFKI